MPVEIRRRSRLAKATLVIASDGTKDVEFWDVALGEAVEPDGTDVLVTVSSTDRLDSIAQTAYGDPRLWDVIGVANGLEIPPLDVKVGDVLRIPGRERVEKVLRAGDF
jgi:nucleoid-associated protein YgaU